MSIDIEQKLRDGNKAVFADLFSLHQPRLWQMVRFRMNDAIRGRVDPEDILQEVFLAAEARLDHFINGDFPTLFLWLRLVTSQVLSNTHRSHLKTEARSVWKESNPNEKKDWAHTSLCLSQRFVAHITSPSQAMAKQELISQVRKALDGMNEIDREVVALRHFEELTNQEVAQELGIAPKAASIRFIRALERLKSVLN